MVDENGDDKMEEDEQEETLARFVDVTDILAFYQNGLLLATPVTAAAAWRRQRDGQYVQYCKSGGRCWGL